LNREPPKHYVLRAGGGPVEVEERPEGARGELTITGRPGSPVPCSTH
jgi:hypothetical protein